MEPSAGSGTTVPRCSGCRALGRYNNRENDNIRGSDPGVLMRPRRQYRLLQASYLFALVGLAFSASYAGMYPYERAAHHAAHEASSDVNQPESIWGFLTSTPESAAAIILCFITVLLAVFTCALYVATSRIASEAFDASNQTIRTLVGIERPYVTVGGEYKRDRKSQGILHNRAGRRFFRQEIGNYGKTLAHLMACEIRFTTLATVQTKGSDIDRKNGIPHPDWLAPRDRHKVIRDDIAFDPTTAEVAYGSI
jgi:hypothetical protein